MSWTSQEGDLGIATQLARGGVNRLNDTDLAKYLWLPTLRLPQFATRNADELPKEISGRRGSNGSFVTNVAADGTVEFLPRGRSLIPIFMSLMGSGISAASGTGAEEWHFDVSEDYNWLSLWKNVGDAYGERYGDALVDGITITLNNSQPARIAADLLACDSTPTKKFVIGGTDPYLDNSAKFRDDIEPLMVVGELAQVYLGTKVNAPGAGTEFLMPVRNAEFRLGNGSSRDEYVIGSLFRNDVTKLDLIMQMTAEVVISDAELYGTVMYDDPDITPGADIATRLVAMQGFYIEMMGPGWLNESSVPIHPRLRITFAEVQVVTFPFELQGNNLLTAQVMIRGRLQTNGESPVHIDLVVPNPVAGQPGSAGYPFVGPGYPDA